MGNTLANIWDGTFHNFSIEWRPSHRPEVYVFSRVDSIVIRRESGGDLMRLEEQLDVYTGAWMSSMGLKGSLA